MISESKPYDFLLVGSGLFASVFAHEMTKKGKKCLVLERRNHLGGNVHNQTIDGIITHQYGAHIFHTNSLEIWNYVNQFVKFSNYKHQVKLFINQKLYSFPINHHTLKEWFKTQDLEQALSLFNEQRQPKNHYSNLEEMGISELGPAIFNHFIKEYTEKQWGKPCHELPSSILSRIPIRNNENEYYFEDEFQGIPTGGYNLLIEQLLKGVETKLNIDFLENRLFWEQQAQHIVFTGCIDELFDYQFGKLEYRSLKFETQRIEQAVFQAQSVVNYPSKQYDFTRIIEHKHFHPTELNHTIITKEYPQEYVKNTEAYYPIVDHKNKAIYQQYKDLAANSAYIFGGRLAEFKYYDMHQVIASALNKVKQFEQQMS